jgi:hypothetical protein
MDFDFASSLPASSSSWNLHAIAYSDPCLWWCSEAASPIFLLTKWFSLFEQKFYYNHRFQSSSLSRFSEFEKRVHNFVSPKDSPMSYFANEFLIQRQGRRPINTKSREYLFSKNLVLIKNSFKTSGYSQRSEVCWFPAGARVWSDGGPYGERQK